MGNFCGVVQLQQPSFYLHGGKLRQMRQLDEHSSGTTKKKRCSSHHPACNKLQRRQKNVKLKTSGVGSLERVMKEIQFLGKLMSALRVHRCWCSHTILTKTQRTNLP